MTDAQLRASIRERFPKRDDRTYDAKGKATHKNLTLTADQYETVMKAWRKMQELEGEDITRGYAVELILQDWMAGN